MFTLDQSHTRNRTTNLNLLVRSISSPMLSESPENLLQHLIYVETVCVGCDGVLVCRTKNADRNAVRAAKLRREAHNGFFVSKSDSGLPL